jgi:metal-responsive CopG/Arc/MetJ family transcriptional regulator
MAPGQRDVKKRAFSVSFEKDLINAIEQICEDNGKIGEFENRNAFIKQAAREKLERLNKEKQK